MDKVIDLSHDFNVICQLNLLTSIAETTLWITDKSILMPKVLGTIPKVHVPETSTK